MSDKLEYNNQLVQYGFSGKQLPVSIKARQLSNYPLIMASLLQKKFPRKKIQLDYSPLNRKTSSHSFKTSLSIKRISTPKRKNQIHEEALFITLKPLTRNQQNNFRAQTAHQLRTEQESINKDTGKLWSCQSKRASHFFRSRNRSANYNQNQQQFKITRNGKVDFL